jgi:hypothetical protein
MAVTALIRIQHRRCYDAGVGIEGAMQFIFERKAKTESDSRSCGKY